MQEGAHENFKTEQGSSLSKDIFISHLKTQHYHRSLSFKMKVIKSTLLSKMSVSWESNLRQADAKKKKKKVLGSGRKRSSRNEPVNHVECALRLVVRQHVASAPHDHLNKGNRQSQFVSDLLQTTFSHRTRAQQQSRNSALD